MAGDREPPRAVLDRLDRPVFALDADWRFTYLNGGARGLLDRDRGALDGRVIWDAVPGVMDTALPAAFHGAVAEGETRTATVELNGDRVVEFEAHPGEDGLTVLLRDVTGQRQREQRLRRYETAFNAADEPLYVLDDGGRIREVNDAMVELTGYSREQLVGSHLSMVLAEGELERAERRIRETVFEGDQSVGTIELTVTTAAGSRRTCAVAVALLPDEIGGTVGVMHDVTEGRQREQRLAVLDRVLRHNIRNEMNLVIGRAELAREQGDEAVEPHLEAILATARELVDLSQDIRRFSDALDPGLGEARAREATETITAIVDDLRDRLDADLRVTVREEARFYAHESVFAAIEELVRNGAAHNDRDDATVTVTVDVDEEADRVTLAVADDGPGLPDPERAVLTEGAESPLDHASGLGLWLVNWAVTKSGGHLTFAENEPRGSVVTIHLPRAPPAEALEGTDAGGGAESASADAE